MNQLPQPLPNPVVVPPPAAQPLVHVPVPPVKPAVVGAVPPPQYIAELPVVPQPDPVARPGSKDLSTEADDRMIERFAKIVLKRPQFVQLAALIGKDEPQFTLDEFKILAPYAGNPNFMGTGQATADNAPYCQLYDFCRTVREVFGELRRLKSRVDNLEGTTNIDELISLKKQIHHISYVPWVLLEAMPTTTQLYDVSPVKYRMGEDVKPNSKPKTPYDKAVDIAMLLSSDVVNAMVALTQGLFKCYLTDRQGVQKGQWVNAWDQAQNDPRWGLAGNNENVIDMLRPHPTELQYYPNNWIASELRGWNFPNEAEDAGWVGVPVPGGNFPQMPPLQPEWQRPNGGAVSQWVFVRDGAQVWPTRENGELPVSRLLENPQPGAGGPFRSTVAALLVSPPGAAGAAAECNLGAYNLVGANNKPVNAPDGVPVHALEIDWKSVMNMVKTLTTDPVFAIAQLSDAYNMCGLADYVMTKYQAIQRVFSAKMQQLRQGREMRDVRSLWKAVQFSAPETGGCPADSMTMYRNVSGSLTDEKSATEVINGVRYLKNGYSAGSKQCVPLHRVSDNEITEKSDVDLGLHGVI